MRVGIYINRKNVKIFFYIIFSGKTYGYCSILFFFLILVNERINCNRCHARHFYRLMASTHLISFSTSMFYFFFFFANILSSTHTRTLVILLLVYAYVQIFLPLQYLASVYILGLVTQSGAIRKQAEICRYGKLMWKRTVFQYFSDMHSCTYNM